MQNRHVGHNEFGGATEAKRDSSHKNGAMGRSFSLRGLRSE
jgi:hypothetical protein